MCQLKTLLRIQSTKLLLPNAATQRRFNSAFAPINVNEVKSEFRAYGNGSIDFTTDKNIGIITLNHHERRNAISGKMMAEFHDLVTHLETRVNQVKDIKGLILTGAGDFFCAGGDLQTISTFVNTPQKGWEMSCLMHETLSKLSRLPIISVALVNGRAVGGGAELTLAPDLRAFAKTKGKLSFVQAKMGVIPGWGGATRLKNLVGQSKALEILLSCRTLSSNEHQGLCDQVVSDDKCLEETQIWLEKLVQHDQSVLTALKQTLNSEASFELERNQFAPLWGGPANKKALSQNLKH